METYRNTTDLISLENEFVDADSLWEKRGELMVLVDDDRYVTFPYSETKFYRVYL